MLRAITSGATEQPAGSIFCWFIFTESSAREDRDQSLRRDQEERIMTEKHGKLTAGLLQEKVKVTNPVKIQDLTFRDAHQSIFATRGDRKSVV